MYNTCCHLSAKQGKPFPDNELIKSLIITVEEMCPEELTYIHVLTSGQKVVQNSVDTEDQSKKQ